MHALLGRSFVANNLQARARAEAGESGSRVVNDYLARANGLVESRPAFIAEVAARRPQVDIYLYKYKYKYTYITVSCVSVCVCGTETK